MPEHKLPNPQTAQAVLSYALSNGWLSPEQVSLAIARQPTAEMMRIASWLHQACCIADHSNSECSFIDEELTEDGSARSPFEIWELPAHTRWLQQAIRYMALLECSCEEDFTKLFHKARMLNENLNRAKESDPQAYALLLLIRGWED